MPRKKREITVRFVTTSPGTGVSSIIDAISDLADDVTITCKVLNLRAARTPVYGTNSQAPPTLNSLDEEAQKSDRPQLAYRADLGSTHRRYIDVDASLRKLGLSKDQLMLRSWPRGSPHHRLKRAAVNKPKNGVAAD